MNFCFRAALLALALVPFVSPPSHADPRSMMGSGNFNTDHAGGFDDQFQVLRLNNVTQARINAYPNQYWRGGQAVTDGPIDAAVLKAHEYEIQPIILINYYATYWNTLGVKLGGPEKWRAIGQKYAERYRPNSPWLREQGIENWGVTTFLAFNEPELDENNGWVNGRHGPFLPINSSDPNSAPDKFDGNYHDALKAFAEGVKSVEKSLKVINGGFFSQNAFRDYKCRGYASGIADLFNSGLLDGLNLHTYNDAQYAPLLSSNSNESSAMNQFRRVKEASGITADVDFYSDEFNYKLYDVAGQPGDHERTAKNLFTQIWTTLGAVKNDGTGATKLALLWSLFPAESTYTTNEGPLMPYNPRPAARVYKWVADHTAGLEFSMLDPFGAAKWEMTEKGRNGDGKKAWIWINANGYSNVAGQDWTISGIPRGTREIRLFGWDGFNGPRQTFQLNAGQTSLSIPSAVLPQGESFVAIAGQTRDSQPLPEPLALTQKWDKLAPLRKGIAKASSAPFSGEEAAKAFDGRTSSKWLGNFEAGQTFLEIEAPNGAKLTPSKYSLTSANDEPTRDPKSWKLQGWNGASWVDLDEQTGQNFAERFQKRDYEIRAPRAFSRFRLLFLENGGANLIQISEFLVGVP